MDSSVRKPEHNKAAEQVQQKNAMLCNKQRPTAGVSGPQRETAPSKVIVGTGSLPSKKTDVKQQKTAQQSGEVHDACELKKKKPLAGSPWTPFSSKKPMSTGGGVVKPGPDVNMKKTHSNRVSAESRNISGQKDLTSTEHLASSVQKEIQPHNRPGTSEVNNNRIVKLKKLLPGSKGPGHHLQARPSKTVPTGSHDGHKESVPAPSQKSCAVSSSQSRKNRQMNAHHSSNKPFKKGDILQQDVPENKSWVSGKTKHNERYGNHSHISRKGGNLNNHSAALSRAPADILQSEDAAKRHEDVVIFKLGDKSQPHSPVRGAREGKGHQVTKQQKEISSPAGHAQGNVKRFRSASTSNLNGEAPKTSLSALDNGEGSHAIVQPKQKKEPTQRSRHASEPKLQSKVEMREKFQMKNQDIARWILDSPTPQNDTQSDPLVAKPNQNDHCPTKKTEHSKGSVIKIEDKAGWIKRIYSDGTSGTVTGVNTTGNQGEHTNFLANSSLKRHKRTSGDVTVNKKCKLKSPTLAVQSPPSFVDVLNRASKNVNGGMQTKEPQRIRRNSHTSAESFEVSSLGSEGIRTHEKKPDRMRRNTYSSAESDLHPMKNVKHLKSVSHEADTLNHIDVKKVERLFIASLSSKKAQDAKEKEGMPRQVSVESAETMESEKSMANTEKECDVEREISLEKVGQLFNESLTPKTKQKDSSIAAAKLETKPVDSGHRYTCTVVGTDESSDQSDQQRIAISLHRVKPPKSFHSRKSHNRKHRINGKQKSHSHSRCHRSHKNGLRRLLKAASSKKVEIPVKKLNLKSDRILLTEEFLQSIAIPTNLLVCVARRYPPHTRKEADDHKRKPIRRNASVEDSSSDKELPSPSAAQSHNDDKEEEKETPSSRAVTDRNHSEPRSASAVMNLFQKIRSDPTNDGQQKPGSVLDKNGQQSTLASSSEEAGGSSTSSHVFPLGNGQARSTKQRLNMSRLKQKYGHRLQAAVQGDGSGSDRGGSSASGNDSDSNNIAGDRLRFGVSDVIPRSAMLDKVPFEKTVHMEEMTVEGANTSHDCPTEHTIDLALENRDSSPNKNTDESNPLTSAAVVHNSAKPEMVNLEEQTSGTPDMETGTVHTNEKTNTCATDVKRELTEKKLANNQTVSSLKDSFATLQRPVSSRDHQKDKGSSYLKATCDEIPGDERDQRGDFEKVLAVKVSGNIAQSDGTKMEDARLKGPSEEGTSNWMNGNTSETGTNKIEWEQEEDSDNDSLPDIAMNVSASDGEGDSSGSELGGQVTPGNGSLHGDISTLLDSSQGSEIRATPTGVMRVVTSLGEQRVPDTPSKSFPLTLNDSLSQEASSQEPEAEPRKKRKIKHNLDVMLDIKQEADKMEVMYNRLKSDVNMGGFAKRLERAAAGDGNHGDVPEDDDDDDGIEHAGISKEILEKFTITEEKIGKIPPTHPGDAVFDESKIRQVFSYFSLADCGFSPQKPSALESLMLKGTQEELVEMVRAFAVEMAYHTKPCPSEFMLWMFRLMSVHRDVNVVNKLYQTMWSILNSWPIRHPDDTPWTPSVANLTQVLVNYGASFSDVLPAGLAIPGFDQKYILAGLDVEKAGSSREDTDRPGMTSTSVQLTDGEKSRYYGNNLIKVVKIFTQSLITSKIMERCPYLEDHVSCLVLLICKSALDKHFLEKVVLPDFRLCMAALFDVVPENRWKEQVENLCHILPHITAHHHNLVHVVALMPLHTERGRFMSRQLAFHCLKKLCQEDSNGYFAEPKVQHILSVLPACKPRRENFDYYWLHSMVQLIELGVGNEVLGSVDKLALQQLILGLRDLGGAIREMVGCVGRSQVKDLIMRATTRLTFMDQAIETDQVDLFNRMLPQSGMKEEVPEEHFPQSQEDAVSDDDDDIEQEEGEEEEDE